MADTRLLEPRRAARVVRSDVALRSPAYQAYQCLRAGYTLLPLLAGVDKFTRLLADWEMYLATPIQRALPISGVAFMYGTGVIEILAGLLVAFRPRVGAWVVAAWLGAITINLLLPPGYYDIALRDVGLIFGASALGLLAREYDLRRA
jgi:hypothetical protein